MRPVSINFAVLRRFWASIAMLLASVMYVVQRVWRTPGDLHYTPYILLPITCGANRFGGMGFGRGADAPIKPVLFISGPAFKSQIDAERRINKPDAAAPFDRCLFLSCPHEF